MDDRDREAWRAWGKNAPAYAMEFFAGSEASEELVSLCQRHGHVSELDRLLELVEHSGTKVTIILQPEGEY